MAETWQVDPAGLGGQSGTKSATLRLAVAKWRPSCWACVRCAVRKQACGAAGWFSHQEASRWFALAACCGHEVAFLYFQALSKQKQAWGRWRRFGGLGYSFGTICQKRSFLGLHRPLRTKDSFISLYKKLRKKIRKSQSH